PLARELECLVADDRERPEHQDEAGLLLVVLDEDPYRTFRHVVRVLLLQPVLLFERLRRVGPHHRHVVALHDDDDDDEREYLVDELDRNVLFFHESAAWLLPLSTGWRLYRINRPRCTRRPVSAVVRSRSDV